MIQWHRLRLWFVSVLVVLLVVAVALWLRGALPGIQRSPLPAPVRPEGSPLPTPMPTSATTLPPSSAGVGATLLWVALGVLLALGITVAMLYGYRRAAS